MPPKKFCKITPKNTHCCTSQIESFSKTKKAFAYASKSRANPNTREKPAFKLFFASIRVRPGFQWILDSVGEEPFDRIALISALIVFAPVLRDWFYGGRIICIERIKL